MPKSTESAESNEVDPAIQAAFQEAQMQEQIESDKATLQQLGNRVALLRMNLNVTSAELKRTQAQNEELRKALPKGHPLKGDQPTKKAATKKSAAKKTTPPTK